MLCVRRYLSERSQNCVTVRVVLGEREGKTRPYLRSHKFVNGRQSLYPSLLDVVVVYLEFWTGGQEEFVRQNTP